MRKKIFTFLLALVTSVGMLNAQSGGISVTQFNVPNEWESAETKLLVSDLPGFGAADPYTTQRWNAVPSTGYVYLIYAFESDGRAKYHMFSNGVRYSSPTKNIWKPEIFSESNNGTKFYYTTGPSNWGPEQLPQVSEITNPPSEWYQDNTYISTDEMPGFATVDDETVKAWDGAPQGSAILISSVGNEFKYHNFRDGVYQYTMDDPLTRNTVYFNITDAEIAGRFFYTTGTIPGGSTPAVDPTPTPSGLQVTELQVVPGSWQDNPTMLSTSDMPGFSAVSYAEAVAWDAAPAGDVVLIFAFEENAATSLYFKNGVYQAMQAYNITYEDVYAWYSLGEQIFYTGGGSTPATGLQVVEVTSDMYAGWNSNSNQFTVNALPGFQAVTFDEAKAWTEVPTSGTAVLVYRTNGDYARVIQFFDGDIMGDYDLETSFNQMYENITIFGNRIFYTAGGGSTPTPPNPSGSCGANVTWEFDPSTGALTITGTGAMDDYLNNASAPWNSYITDITSVTITDGVTNVGNHSFEQCTSLTTVTIGDDVETIGVFAFSECGEQFTTLTLGNSIRTIGNQAFASDRGITGFTLPSTLETIGNFAFTHNKAITTLTIPSNVTSIDADAFYGCTAVTDVYCYPNAADLTWNEADCDDFKSGKATICHVNSDQLDAYQTKFNDVVRVTFVGDLDAPTPDPEPTPSATGVIFANCYDCWRTPEYPTISGQCYLHYFDDPRVGNGNPSGPWKLEFVENYNSSSTEYDSGIVKSDVAGEYGKSPGEMEVYRLYQWQNGAYQPVAYGVLYAYANENNQVEHAAFFEASGFWGCYLTDNTHSYGDNINITFNEDASTGFADLHPAPTPTPDPTPTPSGDGDKLAGAFSVGGDKVVYFSKANLQATTADNGSTWTWGFAENQWDYVGNNAANNAINGGGTVSTNGPVDLFAWSSTDNNYFGINNSINEADYSGDFKDWGAKKGSDWRTLTINEWQYLLQERNPGSSSANYTKYPRYTNAQILTDGTAPQKDIKGIILFPDDFNDGGESIDGVTWGSINPSFFSSYPTTCTTAGWATLESMGCVFLPSAGSRQNVGEEFEILDVNQRGNYWSSTLSSGEPEDPQSIAVGNGTLGIGTNPRYFGMSVRLVSSSGSDSCKSGNQVIC